MNRWVAQITTKAGDLYVETFAYYEAAQAWVSRRKKDYRDAGEPLRSTRVFRDPYFP